MDIGELIKIKTLEDGTSVFDKNERHTRYTTEIKIFSCVQQGDINKLIKELKNISALVVTGKLSNDSVMQLIIISSRCFIWGLVLSKTSILLFIILKRQ